MRAVFCVLIFLVSTPSLLNAATIGLDISAGGASTAFDDRDYTLGWKFSLSEDVVLTALGTWDQNANGLNQSQQVRLWKTTGELVASSTVDNSAEAIASENLAGQWLFSNVADTLLAAGDYLIGADRFQGSGDAVQIGASVLSTEPRITWIEARYSGLDFFGIPQQGLTGNQYFGPNLMVKSVSVPEPATLGILGVSLAGLWVARRRKA